MCYKYPGLRCGNALHERVESISSQLEEAKAFSDSLDPDEFLVKDINRAKEKVAVLEAQLKNATAKYDATKVGYAALVEESNKEGLSVAERTALAVRIKEAENAQADSLKSLRDASAREGNVTAYLESLGVSPEIQAEFADPSIYRPAAGSAKHYATIKDNRMAAFHKANRAYSDALAKAKTPQERDEVEATHGLAVAKCRSDYNRALYAYDSTAEGLSGLRKRLAGMGEPRNTEELVAKVKLENRLDQAQKGHKYALEARNLRTAKLARLKAVVAEHGGSIATATTAFKNKSELPKAAKGKTTIPAEHRRIGHATVHMTPEAHEVIVSEFEHSDEYKTYGERGFSRFMENKALRPPHEIYLSGESLASINGKVVIASNGKVGRNPTFINATTGEASKRATKVAVALSQASLDNLRSKARFFETSVSSYMLSMVGGGNPVAQQNDRSAEHRAVKNAKMRGVIDDRVIVL